MSTSYLSRIAMSEWTNTTMMQLNLSESADRDLPRERRGGIFKDRHGNWRAWTIFGLICSWLPPLLIAYLLISGFGGADGYHTGYVTAVEHQHNFTWDSTVVYFKSNPESTQEDKYCVRDPDLRQLLEWYARTRRLVTVHYSNGLILWRVQCNGGDSIIVDARPEEPLRNTAVLAR